MVYKRYTEKHCCSEEAISFQLRVTEELKEGLFEVSIEEHSDDSRYSCKGGWGKGSFHEMEDVIKKLD